MSSRVINEIIITKDLEIVNGSEIKEENKKLVEEWNGCDLKVMSGGEIGKLRMKIEVVLRDEKLVGVKNSEIRKLREKAKEIMWGYYCKNKLNLSEYIGDLREEIIVELMKGKDVVEVFDCYGGGGLVKVA